MKDRLGNEFDVGDYVIYTTTGPSVTPHLGTVTELGDHTLSIKTDAGRTISRLRSDVIAYRGIKP